jgi:hypothetical protein
MGRRAAIGALLIGLAALVGVAGATALGDQGAPAREQPAGVGQVRAGSVASLAQCRDWNAGDEAQRRATIEDIRAHLNQSGSDGPTPDLSDEQAYGLFERACANEYAAGFRLYKLYARGAAFSRLGE